MRRSSGTGGGGESAPSSRLFPVSTTRSELIPQFALDRIRVQVVWEGATPEEVEEGICIKIEEALTGVEGMKTVTSTALEHNCRVIAELQSWVKDRSRALDDVKSAV